MLKLKLLSFAFFCAIFSPSTEKKKPYVSPKPTGFKSNDHYFLLVLVIHEL